MLIRRFTRFFRPPVDHHDRDVLRIKLMSANVIMDGLIECEQGLIHPVGDPTLGSPLGCRCWWCQAKRYRGKPEGWESGDE